ncbi:MAG: putative Ig domain-containing protein [Myxococcales bacterium]|nr:putative Ig domain-containing protein [Myxococcales bacterium]
MVLPLVVGAALLGAPTLASAQLIAQTYPNTYQQLPTPTVLQTDVDDGQTNVTLPFPVIYYDVPYTSITVGHNGALVFPSGQSVSLGNVAPGSASSPNNFIAPFWDDLRLYAANTGYIGYQVQGTAPNRTITFEYWNISRFGSTGVTFAMQVRFFETGNPVVEVDYGPMTGTATFSSTMGMEDAAGANAILFAASGCTSSCTETDYRALINNRVSVGVPVEPDLTGSFGAFPRGAQAGASAVGELILTNRGTNTATAVVSNVYLSTDASLDASDVLIGTATADIPFGDTPVPVTVTVPAATPVADYFLIAEVDATNAWTERNETDNVFTATQRFATSYDVQPTGIRVLNLGGVNGGDPILFEVDVTNNGIPYSGPLEVGLYASSDTVIDATDHPVATVTVTLTGGSNIETFQASGTMPVLPPGAYYPVAVLDPNNLLIESSEVNNQFLGATTFNTGPDFAVAGVDIPGSVQPGASIMVTTTIDSLSVPFTGNVPYRLYASADNVLDTTMDINLGLFNAAMAGEASLPDTESVVFPASIPAGRYYIIAAVDPSNSIPEVTIANNSGASSIQLFNAVDFTMAGTTASPTSLEVGQTIHVTGTAASVGLPFTGNVPYSVYVSLDNIWDPGDQRVFNDLVFFPGNGTGSIDATFSLRALQGEPQIRPGTYYIVLRVDSTNIHAEVDEVNNAAVGTRVTLTGSDLLPTSISSDPVAFIGLPFRMTVEIENQGVAPARGFTYSYFLSENDIIRVSDDRIYTSQSATIAPGASQVFEDIVTLPALTSTACLYLGVIVNDNGYVSEANINNNTRRIAGCIEFVFPIPDLVAQIIATPTVAAAGEEFAVTRLINNIGVADASSFSYTYYLSSNPTISTDDIPVGTFNGSIGTGADDYGIDVLQVPPTVAQGSYYVGLIVDPDDTLDEVIEDNNTAVGPQIPVYGASIRFITDSLPNATIGVAYNQGVYARGGPLPITWSVSRGNLPPGLSMDTNSGIISGQPTSEGLYEFVLRASSGTSYAEKPFDMRVIAPTVELRVATAALPSAIAGREYTAQLIAVGGQVPYTWAAVSDLPVGMSLSEQGVLSGAPTTPGALPITVRVRDGLDNAASRELVLNVISASQTLQIAQVPLPTAVISTPYCDPDPVSFEARNGTPPYAWSAVGSLPDGMSLSSAGDLCGTPTQVGSYPITVRVQDATGLFDTSLFILEVDDGTELAVSTFSLEAGKVGEAYSANLTAIRGAEPYAWSVVDGAGDLPAGISLASDGTLSGTPSEPGSFAFVVQVVDAQLRADVQPLSLSIAAKDVPVQQPDDGCTCVTDDSQRDAPWASMAGLLAMGGIFMFGRRRRRGLLGLLTLGALVAFSQSAVAQTVPVPGTPYQRGQEAITYTPLSNPTVLQTDVDDGQTNVTLPFPFYYYDGQETSVTVGHNGAIVFPSGQSVSLGNVAMGSTSTPNNIIALFWDDLRLYAANSGYIGTQLEGTAPNRKFTIEYRNISMFGNTGVTWSMKVVLWEGRAARFDLEYGPIAGSGSSSATMGCEDSTGGRPILFAASACTTSCALGTDLAALVNQRITYIQDPGVELAAVGVTAPEFAFLGAETPIPATVQNLHGNPLGPFTVQIRAADNEFMNNSVAIGSTTVSLAPFQSQTIIVPSVFPASFGQTRVWLQEVVDATNAVAEVNENNNTRNSDTSTRLLQGAPDLAVEHVSVDRRNAQAGGQITIYSRIRNVGGETANNAAIGIMMSTNPVISRQDIQLATFNATLAAGETLTSTNTVTVPAGTNSGSYYFGALADIDGMIVELNESNNGRATFEAVSLAGGALAVSTTALPTGYLFQPYVGLLSANGATPPYRWEIVGTLPQGIGFVPETGELFGRPSMAEVRTFTARVTSSDNQTAERQLSINVSDPAEPLTIVTRAVPAAVVGQEYAFPLVVTGGSATSSLTWSQAGLPDSFGVSAEGILVGNPAMSGEYAFTLTVSDGTETATRDISLTIRDNATLLIVPKTLATAQYGQAYVEQLESTGGIEPITWLLMDGSDLPDGMNLSPTGELSGTPSEVGEFRLIIEARDNPGTGVAARDVNTFILTVQDATTDFQIVTASLPVAYMDAYYEVSVAATGGTLPYEWTVVEGRIPEGLLADIDPNTSEFVIRGQADEPTTVNLLIQAVDADGRSVKRAFVLDVQETKQIVVTPTEDTGCTCVAEGDRAPGAGLMLFGLAGLLVLVRRRR